MLGKVFIVALVIRCSVANHTNATCPHLSNTDAEFYKSWLLTFKNKDQLAGRLHNATAGKLSEPLNQCLASMRPGALIPWRKLPSCIQAGLHFFPNKLHVWRNADTRKRLVEPFHTLRDQGGLFIDGLKSGKIMKPLNQLRGALLQVSNEDYEKHCQAFQNKVNPCLLRVIELFVNRARENVCCDAFRQEFQEMMGAEISLEYFAALLHSIQDIGCARHKKTNDSSSSTCGYQLSQAVFGANLTTFVRNALVSVQIPNNQTCDAFEARPFYPTTGSNPYRFERSIGCCANYIDNAFTFFSRIPMLRKKLSNAMFLPGQCQPMSKMICVHLPNRFKNACEFSATCSAKSDEYDLDSIISDYEVLEDEAANNVTTSAAPSSPAGSEITLPTTTTGPVAETKGNIPSIDGPASENESIILSPMYALSIATLVLLTIN